MDILVALKQEEVKLQRQLKGIQGAIASLNGSGSDSKTAIPTGVPLRRTMSASAKAKISKAAKVRWAKFRADKAKKAK